MNEEEESSKKMKMKKENEGEESSCGAPPKFTLSIFCKKKNQNLSWWSITRPKKKRAFSRVHLGFPYFIARPLFLSSLGRGAFERTLSTIMIERKISGKAPSTWVVRKVLLNLRLCGSGKLEGSRPSARAPSVSFYLPYESH